MTFSRRIINLQFRLGQGDFGEDGSDTISLEGLRCTANITQAGGAQPSQLDLRVWGMTLDQMAKLTVLNKLAYSEFVQNTVTVQAGDEDSGVAVCFQGTIAEAWADGREPADMVFQVSAFAGLFAKMKPIQPTSYNGSADAALALSGIAQQMQLGFENSGVTAKIDNPYWPGDLGSQLDQICRAAHCEYAIDDINQVLAVWPKGKSRNGDSLRLAADSGMVGYPSFTQNGIQLTALYNPSLAFGLSSGRSINVESQLKPANGAWVIAAVAHNLESNMPGGAWFTQVECGYLGHI
ncbi:MAG: hypothetical protein KGM49_00650 [Sphingomonadales bacterium]|nr:hypothetical protein [Sphingomonadales bacterium]